jgi:hypothetical protein
VTVKNVAESSSETLTEVLRRTTRVLSIDTTRTSNKMKKKFGGTQQGDLISLKNYRQMNRHRWIHRQTDGYTDRQ